jgi:putative phosphoribosyl transferase
MRLFRNREEAAAELAGHLAFLAPEKPLVIGIPNGGVPVAEIIAKSLDAPLDILLLSKLCAPRHPDHVVGAVDEHGRISMIQSTARWHHLTSQQMIGPARQAFAELQRSRARFRAILPEMDVRHRLVVIVDHGVESGARMLGAIASVKDRGAAKVIVAAPAGSHTCTWQLHEAANMVVIPHTPPNFVSIGQAYQEYAEVSDDLVAAILQRWASARPHEHPGVKTLVLRFINEREQVIHCCMDLPAGATRGSGPYPAVIFAHGFESDAQSPRSREVSRRLAKRGVIGVRMDFTGHGRSEGLPRDATEFRMLGDLRCVFENLRLMQEVDSQRIGLNGAGTGGVVALKFAAEQPQIAALVIRGLVSGGSEIPAAAKVRAPTLLIHAEYDTALRDGTEQLNRQLASTHQLLFVQESNRLFSDPISLELMVGASVDWLVDHLTGTAAVHPSGTPASAANPPTIETRSGNAHGASARP